MGLVARSGQPGRSRATLVILVLASITILTLDFRGGSSVDSVRDAARTLFDPLTSAFDTVTEPVRDVWHGIADYDDVRRENERLREALAAAEGEVLAAAGAAKERDALAELLNLDFVGDIPTVAARVIAQPRSNFDLTIELDRGSDHGIAEGMAVVTGDGLVGSIVSVSGGRSRVRLVTDPQFAAGVRIPDAEEDGIANGAGPGRPLRIDLVPAQRQVQPGAVVVTSGLAESLFPRGIPVGTVRSARRRPGALQLDLTLTPSADLDRLDTVKVLQWLPPA